jgi:hypothetical protein
MSDDSSSLRHPCRKPSLLQSRSQVTDDPLLQALPSREYQLSTKSPWGAPPRGVATDATDAIRPIPSQSLLQHVKGSCRRGHLTPRGMIAFTAVAHKILTLEIVGPTWPAKSN